MFPLRAYPPIIIALSLVGCSDGGGNPDQSIKPSANATKTSERPLSGDAKVLQGTWVDVEDAESRWEFNGNEITMHHPPSAPIKSSISRYALDEKSNPKGITLSDEEGSRAAAYEIKDHELVVWFHPIHDDQRPAMHWKSEFPWIVRHFKRQN